MNGHDLLFLGIRALAGGGLVVLFSLIAEVLSPKAFSGLFAAAPSVAIASLAIAVAADGTNKAREHVVGMTVGGVAMAGCCVLAVTAIPRLRAIWGSAAAWAGWAVIAFGLYWEVFVGAR